MKKAILIVVWNLAMMPIVLTLTGFGLYATTELKCNDNYLWIGYPALMVLLLMIFAYQKGFLFYRCRHLTKPIPTSKDEYFISLWLYITFLLLMSVMVVDMMTYTNVTLHNSNSFVIPVFSGILWVASIPVTCKSILRYYRIFVDKTPLDNKL